MSEIKELGPREHILIRPNMYIGAISQQTSTDYIDGVLTTVEYIPALVKIINEIIDNSVDIAIKTKFHGCNEINVKITDEFIEVQDNGPGIPVQQNERGKWLPYVCWGCAMAGSNFEDKDRVTTGMNGVGSYCTNVWSKKFIGISDDGKNRYEITFKNNAESYVDGIFKSVKSGVTVKFYPDLERFGIEKITQEYVDIIRQRLINLCMCFPLIKFKFNGQKIIVNNFKRYVQLFNSTFELFETPKYKIAFLPGSSDEFQQFSYVNGLKIPDGGIHIDYISNAVVQRIKEKLEKKYKTIKPADIKNRLFLIVFMSEFSNPKFNSQTKEKLTNSFSDMTKYLDGIDFDEISKKILKNENIINPIVDIFKIKEEFKRKQELKALDKPVKKIKDDNYTPATKNKKYLLICEGASAAGGLMPCFGRDDFGYYTLRGKPLNTWSCTQQKFTANKELSGLYQVIKNEGYTDIVFATDADLDGTHIRALLSGFSKKYLDEFNINIGMLETPVIGYFKGDVLVSWIYTLGDKVENASLKSFYYKGLGSWNKDDLKKVIKTDGIEKMIVPLDFSESTESLDEWLGNDSNPRKKYILENDFDISKI